MSCRSRKAKPRRVSHAGSLVRPTNGHYYAPIELMNEDLNIDLHLLFYEMQYDASIVRTEILEAVSLG